MSLPKRKLPSVPVLLERLARLKRIYDLLPQLGASVEECREHYRRIWVLAEMIRCRELYAKADWLLRLKTRNDREQKLTGNYLGVGLERRMVAGGLDEPNELLGCFAHGVGGFV